MNMKNTRIYLILFTCIGMLIPGCSFFGKKSIDISSPNTWAVSIDPKAVKTDNEFDAIVVGAGIGGLSCASFLAKNGLKVLVLEQNEHVGGFVSSYERNGFTFQAGAHDIVTVGIIKLLLETLGLNKDDLFALHTRTYQFGDKTFTFTGTKDDVVEQLSQAFPAEQQAIGNFFDEAKRALAELGASRKDPAKKHPTLDAWEAVTYEQKLKEYFHDPELIQFLYSLLGYLGTKPENTIARAALLANLTYFIYGGYYPKKGGQAFADTLKNYIESHHGMVLTKAKVDEILVHDNHVTGVRVGQKTFISPIVIANANAKTTFLKLLAPGTLDTSFINAINTLKMSRSVVGINLGVDLDLSHLTSIVKIKKPDFKFSFVVNSNADPSTAPTGNASISIGEWANYADVPPMGTPEYTKYKDELVNAAIAKLEKVIPGISNHIVVKDVFTPRTFEHYTSMPEGAIYSFDQSKGSKRPYFKTPIQGLYLSSASTLIGAGVEAVVATGFVVARDILENVRK